jgi:uncharacterized membrane protein YfcA
VISPLDTAALLAAGAVAGAEGSAGGITSLVSYPALLAFGGLPALSASFANNVALAACWPGAALGSRPELVGRAGWLRTWGPAAAAAGASGGALLLVTPRGAFARIVPFLVLAGALALLLEPRLTAWRGRRDPSRSSRGLAAWLSAVSAYNGYFGAGAGVMTLTLMLVFIDPSLPIANALKNMLVGAATAASAVLFVVTGSVAWPATVPLAIGLFVGSRAGPLATRRLPAPLLRSVIALLGVALAVQLWVDPRL